MMKRLIILFVLFATNFYGQNITLNSDSYFREFDDDEKDSKTIIETKIEIKLIKNIIILTDYLERKLLTDVKLKREFIDEQNDKGTIYSCKDKSVEIEFVILREKSTNKIMTVMLSYEKYLVVYNLYQSKNEK